MLRAFLKSKIHRAVVTEANLHYEGSITLGKDLLDAADLLPFEKVDIYNISNGERFTTYVIAGKSGTICMNGAAAWKARVGDRIIIVSYCQLNEDQALRYQPSIIRMGEGNLIETVTQGCSAVRDPAQYGEELPGERFGG